MIELRGVAKTYIARERVRLFRPSLRREIPALRGINLQVQPIKRSFGIGFTAGPSFSPWPSLFPPCSSASGARIWVSKRSFWSGQVWRIISATSSTAPFIGTSWRLCGPSPVPYTGHAAGRVRVPPLHTDFSVGPYPRMVGSAHSRRNFAFRRSRYFPRLIGYPSLAASYGFAFLFFGLTLRFKDAESVVSVLGNSAPLLGGVFFSVTLLPHPLRVLSLAFPFTYGADALRALWLGTVPLFPLHQELLLLGLLTVGYLALGWWALLRFERLAHLHGLESF